MRFVPNAITRIASRQVLQVQRTSPTLLFGIGIVGVVGAAVMAARATLKLEGTMIDHEKNVALIKDRILDKEYPLEEQTKDLAFIHIKTVAEVGRLYAPAIALGIVGIGSLTGSHVVLTRRNVALTAAYATIDKAFNNYRRRVIDEQGKEADVRYYHGSEDRTFVQETENEGGQPKTVKKYSVAEGYAKLFDSRNQNWNKTPEYNLLFLRCQQNYLNDLLKSRGHVILNDAYDALGLDRTTAGAVVGWVMGNGDNYIDFGIWDDQMMDRLHDFVTGVEGAILLDFNVDGVVYELIGGKRR
jgi:hypothetical protein